MLSFNTKIAAAAGFLALGLMAGSVTPASAAYNTTRCNELGCYTVRCNDDGDRCVRMSSYYDSDYDRPAYAAPVYDRPFYHREAHYLCNSDGENCRWTNYYREGDEY